MTNKRRTYRVNADSWTVLKDILVGDPQEFNPDLSRRWVEKNGWAGWKYTGALRGRTVNGTEWIGFGILPEEWKDAFRVKGLEYVIYSYETPIAWRTNGSWVVPNVKYSVTTSKHQGKVRTALSQINGGI